MPKKSTARSKKQAARRAASRKIVRKKVGARRRVRGRPRRFPKAEGAAPVRAYIEALPGWKRSVAERFDEIIAREVPNVRRAIKWSSPLYGIEGQGWFASFGTFSKHVKLTFFRGASLDPPPPSGTSKLMRSLDITEADRFDDDLVTSWVRQASKLPGWGS